MKACQQKIMRMDSITSTVKKIISVVICVAMVGLFVPQMENVYAADTTAPVITSLSIRNPEAADAQGELIIDVDVEEEGAGINNIILYFKDSNSNVTSIETNNDPVFTGHYTFHMSMDVYGKKFRNGEYVLDSVTIWDRNGNARTYHEYADSSVDSICEHRTINVFNSLISDITAPEITKLTIDNADAVDSKGYMTVTMDIVEEGSGVGGISLLVYEASVNGHYYIASETLDLHTGTHTIKIPVNDQRDEVFSNGKHEIREVNIQDKDQNMRVYAGDDFAAICSEPMFTIINSDRDSFIPVINKISIEDNYIETPNVLVVNADISEEGNGAKLRLNFENNDKHTFYLETNKTLFTGNHTLRIPVSPFVGEGEYRLCSAQIYDGTTSTGCDIYSSDEKERAPIEGVTVNLKSSFDISLYGSLEDTDRVIDRISEMEEGTTAVLDIRYAKVAPEALFKAFAGRNKTVVFEDEDVQWVFDGEKISESECKDIDLTTNVEVKAGASMGIRDDKIVVITFSDNGELPGKADVRVNNDYISAKYASGDDQFMLLCEKEGLLVVEDEDIKIDKDEAAVLPIDHNSIFVLSQTVPEKYWEFPKYTWADDYSSVTAERSWTNYAGTVETESETAVTTSTIVKEPTYTYMGETEYTAVFENPAFYPQSRTIANIPKLEKLENSITAKAVRKTISAKKLKKKTMTFSPITVKGKKGAVSYKVVSANAKSKKALKLSKKTGKITVRKGTKKGKYKLSVKVTDSGTEKYKSANTTVSVVVVVKK